MGFEDDLRNIAFPLLRFASFAANAFLFGLIPILLLVLRPAFAGLPLEGWAKGRERFSNRLEGLVRACLVASLAATSLILLLQTALVSEIADGDVSQDRFYSVLETSFGQWHALRIPILAGLAVLLLGRVRSSSLARGDESAAPTVTWWVVWAGLALALLATSTFSGHAMVVAPRVVALPNDIIHLATGATWFAGIVILAVVLPDAWLRKDQVERLELLAPVVKRFSYVAFVSITVVAITGTVSSFLHIGAFDDLWTSAYGRALSVKLLLFAGVLVLGGLNHFKVRHRLEEARRNAEDTESRKVFRKTLSAELALAIGLMFVTGVFVGLSRTGPVEAPPPPADTVIR
jgi:putative copper export protein